MAFPSAFSLRWRMLDDALQPSRGASCADTKFGRLCYVAHKWVNVFGGQNCEPMGELAIQAMPKNVGIVSQ
jgi:hypothetical protein